MKWFHNDKMSLAWAIFVELAVHALFAFQAFLLGGFLGELALTSVFGPAGLQIGAWGLAIFIFGAAFQAFVLGEYMREHVESYENSAKGDGSYIRSWEQVRWLVASIEISSLAFRCLKAFAEGQAIQSLIIGAMGGLALWYAFAQAKVIHASVNRPVTYDINHARQRAGRDIVQDALEVIPKMSAEEKRRFYTGDLSAIDEVSYRRDQEKVLPKKERKRREQARRAQQQREYEEAQGYAEQLLGGEKSGDGPAFLRAVLDDKQDNGNGHKSA